MKTFQFRILHEVFLAGNLKMYYLKDYFNDFTTILLLYKICLMDFFILFTVNELFSIFRYIYQIFKVPR